MSKCKCVNVADFRHRVTLQTLTETADGSGGFTSSWADTVSVWASITPASGYERAQGQQLEAIITHKMMMRYMAGLNTKQRIKFGDRYFSITSIINLDEANRFLQIMAAESSMAAV